MRIIVLTGALASQTLVEAADLPAPYPPVARPAPLYAYPVDPGPASTNGYYGYYGTDIAGAPYKGLYSEPVTCIRSLLTPYGYRTVDVCR